jgi:hypothetical protein
MTNHPKDRHVLAAAVRCHAEVIVTHNVKDFPRTALEPYSITVLGPSTFLRNLYEIDPEFVADTLERQAMSINRTMEYVLDRLSINARGFVSFFKTIGLQKPGGSERRAGTRSGAPRTLPFSCNQRLQLNAYACKASGAQPIEDTS